MKSSCISYPEREPLVIIRSSQVAFCDGNTCAAALLSFFEYWHNIRLSQSVKSRHENDIAERHNEPAAQNYSLWQFHTSEELSYGILGMYSVSSIRDAIRILQVKGVIKVGRNPNPKYKFDNTKFFLFNPDPILTFLTHRPVEIVIPSAEIVIPPVNFSGTIPETTSEISPDTNSSGNGHVGNKRSSAIKKNLLATQDEFFEEEFSLEPEETVQSPPPKKEKSLHSQIQIQVTQRFEKQFRAACPWDGGEGKALAAAIKANPRWTLETWERALRNYFASDGVPPHRPRAWLPKISSYLAGPLDRFGKLEPEPAPVMRSAREVLREQGVKGF